MLGGDGLGRAAQDEDAPALVRRERAAQVEREVRVAVVGEAAREAARPLGRRHLSSHTFL